MDAGQLDRTRGTVLTQSASGPPPYSTPTQAFGQATTDAPPDYQTVIETQTASSSRGEADSAEHAGPTTLTIDGRHIVSSMSPQQPIYSLSHELDGWELNLTGIMLTRIEQTPEGKRPAKAKRRDVFALRDTPLPVGPAYYQIDGKRFLSQKKGHMNKKYTKSGQGWSASGRDLPSFGLRPKSRSGPEGRGYEWCDKMTDRVIAMETRRSWDEKNKKELTPPKLELRLSDDVPAEYLDFLVAAWCMHNWREAKDITKEPLSWEECKYISLATRDCPKNEATQPADATDYHATVKEEAKTTGRNTKNRGWKLGMGGFGVGMA